MDKINLFKRRSTSGLYRVEWNDARESQPDCWTHDNYGEGTLNAATAYALAETEMYDVHHRLRTYVEDTTGRA